MKFCSKSLLLLCLLAANNPDAAAQTEPTLIGWGNLNEGGSPPAITNVSMVSCDWHACVARTKDGKVYAWGRSDYGGTAPSINNASMVTCGMFACAAVTKVGNVVAWGRADMGGNAPVITGATSVSCGQACVALKDDGTIVAWGAACCGGNAPAGLTNVSSVTCGLHACGVLKNDGTVVTWGDSGKGGNVNSNNSTPLTNISKLNCFVNVCTAIKDDGTLIAWGPSDVGGVEPANTKVSKAACGNRVCAALKLDGSVVGWGDVNFRGVAPDIEATEVSCGAGHICFALLKVDGSVVQWGGSVVVPTISGVNAISCGENACVAYYSEDIAGGGGDPHFFGFGGTFFTWQAQCDAILLKSSKECEDDTDLEVHIRTTKVRKWAKIDAIAFTAGDDMGEINSQDAKLILNGREISELNNASFSVVKSKVRGQIYLYTFKFPKQKNMQVKVNTRTNMIYVTTSGRYPDGTQGLLGSPRNPGLVSRDGIKMQSKEVNAFGESWQVRDSDRHLFRVERFPQFPSKCVYEMNKIKGNTNHSRVLKALPNISREEAANACKEHSLAPMRKFCIDDIMMTGDIDTAVDEFYG